MDTSCGFPSTELKYDFKCRIRNVSLSTTDSLCPNRCPDLVTGRDNTAEVKSAEIVRSFLEIFRISPVRSKQWKPTRIANAVPRSPSCDTAPAIAATNRGSNGIALAGSSSFCHAVSNRHEQESLFRTCGTKCPNPEMASPAQPRGSPSCQTCSM